MRSIGDIGRKVIRLVLKGLAELAQGVEVPMPTRRRKRNRESDDMDG